MTEPVYRVRFNPMWAVPAFSAGVLNAYLFSLGALPLLAGFLTVTFPVLGGLLLWRPMLRVDARSVEVKNLLGMTLKVYPLGDLADLRFEKGALVIAREGEEPVRVRGANRWMAAPRDWDRLARGLGEGGAEDA